MESLRPQLNVEDHEIGLLHVTVIAEVNVVVIDMLTGSEVHVHLHEDLHGVRRGREVVDHLRGPPVEVGDLDDHLAIATLQVHPDPHVTEEVQAEVIVTVIMDVRGKPSHPICNHPHHYSRK